MDRWVEYFYLHNREDIAVTDIILTAISIAGMFTPVYFSIIMDKIKDMN